MTRKIEDIDLARRDVVVLLNHPSAELRISQLEASVYMSYVRLLPLDAFCVGPRHNDEVVTIISDVEAKRKKLYEGNGQAP